MATRLGRTPDAIAFAEAVVARDPRDPASHSLLASAYWYAGRLDESIASYRETVRLSPGYIGAHDSLSNVLVDKGDP